MVATKELNFTRVFGSYIMKTQYETLLAKKQVESNNAESKDKYVLQETVEDYIEQA